MLKTTVKPTGEEELDDYVKDLVEITIKMMVSGWRGVKSECCLVFVYSSMNAS